MSSIVFQFYYDDGSIRPFDPDEASSQNETQFEVPVVITDGLIDIFELTDEEMQEFNLIDAAFLPSFIADYRQIAEADGKALDGIGKRPNIYCEGATIPVDPSQLKSWADKWLQTLQRMDEQQLKEVICYNWNYINVTTKALSNISLQVECALAHSVSIMLFIAW